MEKPQATLMVAQAPMCLVNAWPLISRLKSNFRWKIVYLTRSKDEGHNSEMAEAWAHTGVELEFLQLEHIDKDEENFEISFDRDLATSKIQTACAGSDLLVTHNHLGDHGHVYNVFVNSVVSEIDIPKVYFGYRDDNDNNLIIWPKSYGNLQIPIDKLRWTKGWITTVTPEGKYQCDPRAKQILKTHSNGLNFDLPGA
jgi:hypothetical protein